jgi:hypothetical protein
MPAGKIKTFDWLVVVRGRRRPSLSSSKSPVGHGRRYTGCSRWSGCSKAMITISRHPDGGLLGDAFQFRQSLSNGIELFLYLAGSV